MESNLKRATKDERFGVVLLDGPPARLKQQVVRPVVVGLEIVHAEFNMVETRSALDPFRWQTTVAFI